MLLLITVVFTIASENFLYQMPLVTWMKKRLSRAQTGSRVSWVSLFVSLLGACVCRCDHPILLIITTLVLSFSLAHIRQSTCFVPSHGSTVLSQPTPRRQFCALLPRVPLVDNPHVCPWYVKAVAFFLGLLSLFTGDFWTFLLSLSSDCQSCPQFWHSNVRCLWAVPAWTKKCQLSVFVVQLGRPFSVD